MEINRTTLNSLTTVYSNSHYRSNSISSNPNPEINYLYNNVCGLAFSIDFSKNHLIIPMFCRSFIDDAIYNILNGESVDECIVGLYANGRPSDKRTANAIFKYFNNTSFGDKLSKVVTNKGVTYYGGHGIILDKDMKPLVLCAIEGEFIENNFIRNDFKYTRAVIYVHPSVFSSSEVVEKGIIKTLIPAYTSRSIRCFFRGNITLTPEVVIKDFTDDFFIKPVVPKPSEFTKENINTFLLDYVDDIVSAFRI